MSGEGDIIYPFLYNIIKDMGVPYHLSVHVSIVSCFGTFVTTQFILTPSCGIETESQTPIPLDIYRTP